jgi:hypothetical protein
MTRMLSLPLMSGGQITMASRSPLVRALCFGLGVGGWVGGCVWGGGECGWGAGAAVIADTVGGQQQ